MISGRALAGTVLLLGGAGALAYVLLRRDRLQAAGLGGPITATLQPPAPLPTGRHDQAITLQWVSASAAPAVVQGTIIQAPPVGPAGLVGGHWFAAPDVAKGAIVAYDAGNQALAAQMAATPAYRLAAAQSAAGNAKVATLYATTNVQPGLEWWFWIRSAGQALIADPVGTPAGQLPAPDFRVPLQ